MKRCETRHGWACPRLTRVLPDTGISDPTGGRAAGMCMRSGHGACGASSSDAFLPGCRGAHSGPATGASMHAPFCIRRTWWRCCSSALNFRGFACSVHGAIHLEGSTHGGLHQSTRHRSGLSHSSSLASFPSPHTTDLVATCWTACLDVLILRTRSFLSASDRVRVASCFSHSISFQCPTASQPGLIVPRTSAHQRFTGCRAHEAREDCRAMPPKKGNIRDKVRALREKNAGAAPSADASEAGSAAADTEQAEAPEAHLIEVRSCAVGSGQARGAMADRRMRT